MIKIDLPEETVNKIKKIYWEDFLANSWGELDNIIHLMILKGYNNTSNLLLEEGNLSVDKVKNLCLVSGKENLQTKINEFEVAINNDSLATGVSVDDIKKFISNASDNNGYENIYIRFSNRKAAIEILRLMNIPVCPYCNRIYTFTINEDGRRTKPELDHFYPKSLFPYMAITIFNLVPSCGLCNKGKGQNAVNQIQNTILYPYEESFEDDEYKIKFTLSDTDIEYILAGNDITISLDAPAHAHEDIRQQYDDSFTIKLLYNMHKDYIQEIIKKVYIYNDRRILELLNSFNGLFTSEEEIIRLLFGNYTNEKDLGKRPLAKLTKDILEEYRVI